MKKFLLALAIAASAQVSAFAQGYTFTQTTGTYADLTGATVISTPAWEATSAEFIIPIGFNFMIDGEPFNEVVADGWGDLYFSSTATEKAIYAFDAPLYDKGLPSTTNSLSPVSYSLTGTAGSRILKIEYKNAGVITPQPGGQATINPADVANFQVWLFEGSNNVEFHYGNISVANIPAVFFGAGGPTVAVINDYATTITGYFLEGPIATPTLTTFTQSPSYPGLDGIPANGTVYTFSARNTTGIAKNLTNAAISVYPNPVADRMTVSGLTAKGNVTVKITDVLGKVVLTEKVAAAQNVSVNVSNLKKGAYFVEIVSEEGRVGKQIIKQ